MHNVKLEGKIQPFKHFKECMVYFVPTIAIQIYTILDKTMIGLITNSDFENGYYEQAEKIVKLPLTVITTMNIIMRSRISYYFSNKEFDKIKVLTRKSTCFSLMLSIPIMLGSIAIAKKFVPFYLGSGYDECILLIYILAPLILIISLSNLLGTHYYTPYNLQRTSNKFLIIGAIVNVILNIPLIYFFKSKGAAIASVSAELIITVLYIIFAKKFFTFKELFLCGYKYCIGGVIMFGATFTLDYYLPNTIWYLLLEISCGIGIYFLVLLLIKDQFLLTNIKKLWHDITSFRRK
ncbi:MAG: polysaccharide biosynthesis C-terminal domain-containing protein [Anaeroplasmataceae bacterium]|nr:polysaccharide biosynthesis C-terminal domain-containing protein [Anaeroplasmataceae bacterium]